MTGLSLTTEGIRARPWARATLRGLPALALVILFIVTSIRGLNFGTHWDEDLWQVKPVREMVSSGLLFPRAAIYPSVAKWLILLPSLPSAVKMVFTKTASPRDVQQAMLATMNAPGYLLTARTLFVVVSALAIVWVYGAVLALRRPWWEAFLAAAALAFSWEFAYHARWVATDCILVQFAALTMFMLALFQRTGKTGWLHAAAIAAGLGTGTKFPGVILLLPVLLSGALALPRRQVGAQARRAAALCAIAFVTYLITTPATLFDPFQFVESLRYISGPYKAGYYGYGVPSHWHHLALVLAYLSLDFFSTYRVLAVLLFVASVVGAVVWVRRDRHMGLVLTCFPIAFVAFFCFSYLTLMVRNYLLVTPFLALLLGRGLAEAYHRIPVLWGRRALVGVLAVAGAVQAVWLIRAAESIRHFDLATYVRQAVSYVAAHPDTKFRLSTGVRALAAAQKLTLPPNVTTADAQSFVFLVLSEGPGGFALKSNDPWLGQAVFGPREINFSWYSTWAAKDRVVVMTVEKATGAGVSLGK